MMAKAHPDYLGELKRVVKVKFVEIHIPHATKLRRA
jgi:hypothetical protein